jgi:hypothetical protein
MRASEIKQAFPKELVRVLTRRVGRHIYRRTNLAEVLSLLERRGTVLSQVPPVDWRTLSWDGYGDRTFGKMTNVCYSMHPHSTSVAMSTRDAVVDLVRRYITCYGPVTSRDVAWWMGLQHSWVSRILGSLAGELARARIEGLTEDLLDVTTRSEVRLAAGSDAVVRYLPYEDPYLKGLKLRERMIAPPYEKQAYPAGEALPSVVAGGRIIGTWSVSHGPDTLCIRVMPIGRFPARQKAMVGQEGLRLARFLSGGRPLETKVCMVSDNARC